MMRRVEPSTVIIHGPKPASIFHVIGDRVDIKHFPSAISTAHRRKKHGGAVAEVRPRHPATWSDGLTKTLERPQTVFL